MIHNKVSVAGVLAIFALAAAGATAGYGQTPPASAPAGPVCVAVIEPEVLADLPADVRKALAGALDTLLTESLNRQKGIVLVDRQALDKVLDEHKALAGGTATATGGGAAGVALSADQVAQPLRPFWSAGVLVCTRLDANGRMLAIEAVSAQTGQLVAGLYADGKLASADDVAAALGTRLGPFAESITRGAARMQDKPLLAVTGKLSAGLTRMAWMVDDLADAAGATVTASGKAVWLVPRHALVTKEERLLRVMGLGEAREGDVAAGLSPAPRMRLAFELVDSAKTGVAFEKTPITLKLSLQGGADKPVETQIEGEAGQWDACRDKATAWLAAQLAPSASGEGPGEREARARQLSREEIASLGPLADVPAHMDYSLARSARARIARAALRAAHLDPANEQAAWLAARHVMYLYDGGDSKATRLIQASRGIVEAQRYLDRFPKAVADRRFHLIDITNTLARGAINAVYDKDDKEQAILLPPMVEAYPYAKILVYQMAEMFVLTNTDKRYTTPNTYRAFSIYLYYYLIRCIPPEKLEEEYAYWRDFYIQKADPITRSKNLRDFLNTRPLPWSLIDAKFQARRKNPQGVKAAFTKLAAEFPSSEVTVWGGDHRPPRVPLLLQAAGADDWQTWRPGFTARESIKVDLDEMTSFLAGLRGPEPAPWDLGNVPLLPAQAVEIPPADGTSRRAEDWDLGRTEAMFLEGDNVWVVVGPRFFGTPQSKSALFAGRLERSAGGAKYAPVEVPWPPPVAGKEGMPRYTASYLTRKEGRTTIWLGTQSHGLARIEKVDGNWQSRWYTQRDGFPCDAVYRISSARSGAARVLLLSGQGLARHTWALDPVSGNVTLLTDDANAKDLSAQGWPVAVTKDGKRMLVSILGRDGYDLDLADIRSFGVAWALPEVLRDSRGNLRLMDADGEPSLKELSADTLKPLASSPGGSGGEYCLFPIPDTRNVFGRVYWRRGDFSRLFGRWPSVDSELSVGRSDTLWVAFRVGYTDRSARWLYGYRPAPVGEAKPKAADQWIGPFQTPPGGAVRCMAPCDDNKLLLASGGKMYLADCDEARKVADAKGRVVSTEQWRAQFEDRQATGDWRSAMPQLLAAGKWEQAAKLLDQQQPPTAKEKLRVTLWRAHLLTRTKQLPAAAEAYAAAAQDAASQKNNPAEVFARMNQIVVLFTDGRYQEMLDLVGSVNERFPQTVPEANGRDRLAWYIAEARKRLAAPTQPASRPSVDTAIAPGP